MYHTMNQISVAFLVVFTVLGSARSLPAQQGSPSPSGEDPCGPLDEEDRQRQLERSARLFLSTDLDDADTRALIGVDWVSPDDLIEVVSNPKECEWVVTEAVRAMNEEIFPDRDVPVTRATRDWGVFRIGSYFVVPMGTRYVEDSRIAVTQYSPYLIFRLDEKSGKKVENDDNGKSPKSPKDKKEKKDKKDKKDEKSPKSGKSLKGKLTYVGFFLG